MLNHYIMFCILAAILALPFLMSLGYCGHIKH